MDNAVINTITLYNMVKYKGKVECPISVSLVIVVNIKKILKKCHFNWLKSI